MLNVLQLVDQVEAYCALAGSIIHLKAELCRGLVRKVRVGVKLADGSIQTVLPRTIKPLTSWWSVSYRQRSFRLDHAFVTYLLGRRPRLVQVGRGSRN